MTSIVPQSSLGSARRGPKTDGSGHAFLYDCEAWQKQELNGKNQMVDSSALWPKLSFRK
jgi:hypothetical protein